MRTVEKIKKLFQNSTIKVTDQLDNKLLNDTIEAFKNSQTQNPVLHKVTIWRLIMKSKITKLSAAAVIIISGIFSITLLDKAVTPTYAVEQTIEAMQSILTIHAFTTDWDGSKGETWVQLNPENGQEEYNYADQNDLLIVATPQTTYFYHKDKNLVRIQKGYSPASGVNLTKFFEEMPKWIKEHGGTFEINNQFDQKILKKIISVHFVVPAMELEGYIRVDPKTKLPINADTITCRPNQGVKSVDRIEYNVQIPEGLFEFKIPEGAKVVKSKFYKIK